MITKFDNPGKNPVTAIKLCASNVHLLTNRKAVEAIDKGFPQLYAVLSFTFVVKTIDPAIMMEQSITSFGLDSRSPVGQDQVTKCHIYNTMQMFLCNGSTGSDMPTLLRCIGHCDLNHTTEKIIRAHHLYEFTSQQQGILYCLVEQLNLEKSFEQAVL